MSSSENFIGVDISQWPQVEGFPCLPFSEEVQAYDFFSALVRSGRGGYCVSVNAQKLHYFWSDADFRQLCLDAAMATPDGAAATLGLHWLHGLRATKIDMPGVAMRACGVEGFELAVVGAAPEVNNAAVETLRRRYPSINIVLAAHGFWGQAELLASVAAACPKVVLVGMGTPKQEWFARELLRRLPRTTVVGCGGALDVLAGKVKRAPAWVSSLHLEWLYRSALQPSRWGRQRLVLAAAARVAGAALRKRLT